MSAPAFVGRCEGCLLLVWGSSCAAIVHWQYACLVAPVSWRNSRHVPLDINRSNVIPVRLCGSASGTPVMRLAHAVCSRWVPCSGFRSNQRSHLTRFT